MGSWTEDGEPWKPAIGVFWIIPILHGVYPLPLGLLPWGSHGHRSLILYQGSVVKAFMGSGHLYTLKSIYHTQQFFYKKNTILAPPTSVKIKPNIALRISKVFVGYD